MPDVNTALSISREAEAIGLYPYFSLGFRISFPKTAGVSVRVHAEQVASYRRENKVWAEYCCMFP